MKVVILCGGHGTPLRDPTGFWSSSAMHGACQLSKSSRVQRYQLGVVR